MRTFAIGDIHGYPAALDQLLEAVGFGGEDVLITVGDYVDRGPNSKGVLDRLIELHATGRLIPLLGNHEEMLFDALADPAGMACGLWRGAGGNQTLASYGLVKGLPSDLRLIPPEHVQFLREACRDHHETATHLFTHANLDPALPLEDQTGEMLRWRKLGTPPRHVSGKVLVCGHTRQFNGWPFVSPSAICLDTALYSGGWLTCLEVETGRFWQVNKAGDLRESRLDAVPADGTDPDAVYWIEDPD